MKKPVIGYIFCEKNLGKDEKIFLKLAKKKKIEMVLFNLTKEIDDREIKEKIKKCNVIFNNSAEEFAIELVKTAEEFGKKVIDSSKAYYYIEDKWIFFLKCKKHNIPTPETNLLSENLNLIDKELKKFSHWPVILKRIEGTCGEYVERANNSDEAIKIMKKFWKKGSRRIPIIAQEFIKSPSYRVLLIDKEIFQTAIKENNGWKATGVYAKKIKKFKVYKELEDIIKKVVKVFDIKICGIDFLKKNGKWLVLEINSEPAFDFFDDERERIIGKILDFLKKECKN
jgi:RimK family alpha-L-glutamate ligase